MRTAFIWFAIGAVVILLGGFFAFAVPIWIRDSASDVKKLEPLSVGILEDSAIGRDVLIEATVSPRNPTLYRNLVAYRLEERETDSDGDVRYITREQQQPALLLELPDGRVTLAAGYPLSDMPRMYGGGVLYYSGVRGNDTVLVVGELVPWNELATIDARIFTQGTKASYLRDQEQGAQSAFVIGIAFVFVGVVIAGVGAIILFFERR